MGKRRNRCNNCEPCKRQKCGICKHCTNPNSRQCCLQRKCQNLQPTGPVESADRNVFLCPTCQKEYKRKKALDSHIQLKHDPLVEGVSKSHQCEHCESKFSNLSRLKTHKRLKHSQHVKLPWLCKVCSNRFATERGGKIHYTRSHLRKGVKNYAGKQWVQQDEPHDIEENDSQQNEVEDDTEIQWTEQQKRHLVDTVTARIFTAGQFESGKTSLTRTILKNKATTAHIDDRTVVVNFNSWQIDENNTVPIFDLGGHHAYTYVAPFFQSNNASNIGLITHALDRKLPTDYADTYKWIRDTLTLSPKCNLFAVLTKDDCVRDVSRAKETFCTAIMKHLETDIEAIGMQAIKKEDSAELLKTLENFRDCLIKKTNIYVISCKTPDHPVVAKLIDDIKVKCMNNTVVMHGRYKTFYQSIGKVGVGKIDDNIPRMKDIQDNIMTSDSDIPHTLSTDDDENQSIDSAQRENEESRIHLMHYEEYEDLFDKFNEIDLDDDISTLSREEKEEHFKDCLRQLNSLGLIKWFEFDKAKDIVFTDLFIFINVLKSIFNHNIENYLKFENLNPVQKDIYDGRIDVFDVDVKNVKCYGIMSIKLLQVLLAQEIEGLDERVDSIATILVKMQMAFRLLTRSLFFPWFSSLREQPEEYRDEVQNFYKGKNVIYHVEILGSITETFYNAVCVKVFEHIRFSQDKKREMWKNGVFALIGNLHMIMKYDFKKGIILAFKLSINGDEDSDIRETVKSHREMWKCINIVNKEIDQLCKRCACLITKKVLKCPHCKLLRKSEKHQKVFLLENQLKEENWSEIYHCHGSDENLPGALIYPLPKAGTIHMKKLIKYVMDRVQSQNRSQSDKKELEDLPHQRALKELREHIALCLNFKEMHGKLKSLNLIIRRQEENLNRTNDRKGMLEASEELIDVFINDRDTATFNGFLKALQETHPNSGQILLTQYKKHLDEDFEKQGTQRTAVQQDIRHYGEISPKKNTTQVSRDITIATDQGKGPDNTYLKENNSRQIQETAPLLGNTQTLITSSTKTKGKSFQLAVREATRVSNIQNFPSTKMNEPKQKLEVNVEKYELQIVYDPEADGNCFFDAMSHQLKINGYMIINGTDLRQQVTEYMEGLPQTEKDRQKHFVTGAFWSTYVNNMKKEGQWADHVAVTNCANMLKLPLLIITSSDTNPVVEISLSQLNNQQQPLILGHYAEVHYVSLNHRLYSKYGKSTDSSTETKQKRISESTSKMGNEPFENGLKRQNSGGSTAALKKVKKLKK